MKLDKIKFAQLIGYIGRQFAIRLSDNEIRALDDIIDIELPEAPKPFVTEVNELLRCMQSANLDGFIPAIKTYRALTGAGLKESKDAVEKYRRSVTEAS